MGESIEVMLETSQTENNLYLTNSETRRPGLASL